MEFKHPKYYKELRKAGNELAQRSAVKEDLASSGSSPARNKSDQAISSRKTVDVGDSVRPGPGHKRQASSSKRQAATGPGAKLQASSLKHQATSIKS